MKTAVDQELGAGGVGAERVRQQPYRSVAEVLGLTGAAQWNLVEHLLFAVADNRGGDLSPSLRTPHFMADTTWEQLNIRNTTRLGHAVVGD